MDREDIGIILGILGILGILSLIGLMAIFVVWLGTEIDNMTFIEFIQTGISKMVVGFKHTLSRLY